MYFRNYYPLSILSSQIAFLVKTTVWRKQLTPFENLSMITLLLSENHSIM